MFKKYSIAILLLFFILLPYVGISLPDSSFFLRVNGLNGSAFSNSLSQYNIESSDEDFSLSNSANQKIVKTETSGGRRIITLSTGDYTFSDSGDKKKFLQNTSYLNTDNPKIREAAAKFKHSKNPIEDVSLFVYRHINDKKTGIPLIPAASILSSKTGDCTEHSVLTISLLRTLNIPARAVVGIILTENFNGNRNVFVYHMWVEALKEGKWILVDSTRPENIKHSRYIALAYHSLKTEAPLDYLQAISTMQDIKITFVK